MPYFKDQDGRLHFLSDEDVANGGETFLPSDCVAITDKQAATIQGKLDAAQAQINYKAEALANLDKSDMVALRCFKAAVAFPDDWKQFVADNRAIVAASSVDITQALPTVPPFPTGT